MRINIDIPDNQVNNLSAGAKSSLEKESKNYALSIIKEAKLIEEGAHVAGANTEVTDSMIHIAVQKNKYSSKKKTSIKGIIIKTVATLSALFTGGFWDLDSLQNSSGRLITFIILLIITCTSTILLFVYEEKED